MNSISHDRKHTARSWLSVAAAALVAAASLGVQPAQAAPACAEPAPGRNFSPVPTDFSPTVSGSEAGNLPGRSPNAVAWDDGGAWEVGAEHAAADLDAQATSEATSLINRLVSYGWQSRFNYGNAWAWETDFKSTALGGHENLYLDTVDLMFYVGHGNKGYFTFVDQTHNDGSLSTNGTNECSRAWGDGDNEWVALTSCQVLGDGPAADPQQYIRQFSQCFNGTHLILGFKTNAAAQMGTDTQGYNFAKYITQGYTVAQAWYKAADRSQPAGRVVRAVINELEYLNDRPMCGSATCPLAPDSYDYDAWVQTHTAGSEPARYVNVQALNDIMPVYRTAPLNLAQATTQYNNLGVAFGVPVTIPRSMGPLAPAATPEWWTSTTNRQELEMDNTGGLFGYADLNNLWTQPATPTARFGANVMLAPVSPADARGIADSFLRQNNLMAGDAQYYETMSDTLGMTLNPAGKAPTGAEAVEEASLYQVIYSRILTYTPPTPAGKAPAAPIEFSVIGPGAKQKVYVSTVVPTGTHNLKGPLASGILGAQGGWRQLETQPGGNAIETVAILPPSTVFTLYNTIEQRVVMNTPPIDADGRNIMSYTVAYWENAAGVSQGELVPVYQLAISYTQQGNPVTADYAYIPASPLFMRPWAEVESAPEGQVKMGQVVTLTAVDASRTLANLGVDPGLNFALGNGEYGYEWYVNAFDAAHFIGSGRTITYTVNPDVVMRGGLATQNIILVVNDLATTSNQQSSRAMATLAVAPRIVIPILTR